MYNVLFLTDRGARHQEAALRAAPPELNVTMLRAPNFAEMQPALAKADFIISERNQAVTAQMIAAAPSLKLIVRLGSLDYDIDRAAAAERGIQVVVQPVLGTLYCAEHALMMMLACLKRLGRSLHAALHTPPPFPPQRGDEDTFSFNWLNFADIGTLFGKTVSIVGMGEIGVELARLLKPFRLSAVLYNKRTPYPSSVEAELGVRFASLEDCLRQADVLVSLLPYAPTTDYALGGGLTAHRLRLLPPTACLVHLGSGSVLDETEVLHLLQTGELAGAAIDTFEFEPLTEKHPLVLYGRDPQRNLLLTPHVAAASASSSRTEDYAAILAYLAATQR
ncbi:MAG: NAD(P)-dependent oxidoreductase [Aggregatilineales bacterium]